MTDVAEIQRYGPDIPLSGGHIMRSFKIHAYIDQGYFPLDLRGFNPIAVVGAEHMGGSAASAVIFDLETSTMLVNISENENSRKGDIFLTLIGYTGGTSK